jgi:hypothetical protein
MGSNASKRMLYIKGDNGSLKLQLAVRYQAPTSMVMLLLESAEGWCMLLESDAYSQLPLHAMCRNGAHLDMIDLLLRYDEGKSMVMQEDHAGQVRQEGSRFFFCPCMDVLLDVPQ